MLILNLVNYTVDSIKIIVRANLCGLYSKSITEVTVRISCSPKIIRCLVECRADLYREDNNGKTLIRDVVEYRENHKGEIIEYLISRELYLDYIKNYAYCISCYIIANDFIQSAEAIEYTGCISAEG